MLPITFCFWSFCIYNNKIFRNIIKRKMYNSYNLICNIFSKIRFYNFCCYRFGMNSSLSYPRAYGTVIIPSDLSILCFGGLKSTSGTRFRERHNLCVLQWASHLTLEQIHQALILQVSLLTFVNMK